MATGWRGRTGIARWAVAASAGLVLANRPAGAAGEDPAAERQAVAAARALVQGKQYRAAIEIIKPYQPQLSPSSEARDLTLLLGAGYLGDGNAFWAIRTLIPRLEAAAGDCELRVWLAWAYFQVAELDRAREVLGHPSCLEPGPQSARASLLRALMAKTEGQDKSAAADLARAWAAKEMYPADREALPALAERIYPGRIPELSWKLDFRQGYTTNPLLGSPADPNATASISDTASNYSQVSGWFRLSPDLHRVLRPVLEGEVRTFLLDNPNVSALSYLSLTGRLGVLLGSRQPRLFLAWRPEYLRLAGGVEQTTGPNWYLGAHRAEAELEISPWLLAFAGGGRRDFRPPIRDRTELDGGLGGQVAASSRLSIVWAVSGRKHWTDFDTYDLWGGTGLANLLYTFDRGFQARAGVTLAGDSYPSWRGFLDPACSTEDRRDPLVDSACSTRNRRDVFVKTTATLWSPQISGVRLGIQYEYSHRDSTAQAFQFTDHRASALLTWSGTAELSRPRVAASLPLADVPWGLGGADGRLHERVQDYLREDERTLQRSCGCRE
jgi:hypothetical protein